jgi:hypothetical protein
MDGTLRYEFNRELKIEDDLSFKMYESNSASYLLLNPTMEDGDKKLSLVAKDSEN